LWAGTPSDPSPKGERSAGAAGVRPSGPVLPATRAPRASGLPARRESGPLGRYSQRPEPQGRAVAGAYLVGWLTGSGATGTAFALMAASQLAAAVLMFAVRRPSRPRRTVRFVRDEERRPAHVE